MTNPPLRELAEAMLNTAKKATPGPWQYEASRQSCTDSWVMYGEEDDEGWTEVFDCSWVDYEGGGTPPENEDAEHIIACSPEKATRIAKAALLAEEAVWHLRIATEMLQKALEAGMEMPCPHCGMPMMPNADAGWLCGNGDPGCHERQAVGPFTEWGPYMAERFFAKWEGVVA